LERLRFDFPEAPSLAAILANAPNVANLRDLDLSYCRLSAADVRTLVASKRFGRLRCLKLRANRFGAAGVGAILGASSLGALETLDLADCSGDDGPLPSLGAATMRPTSLDLDDYRFGDLATESLATFPGLAGLRRLTTRRSTFGDAGARALAASPYFRPKSIDMRDCALTAEGVVAFASVPSLELVSFERVPMQAMHLRSIGDAAGTELRSLSLTNCGLDVAAIAALRSTALASRLTSMWITNNELGPGFGELLAGFSSLTELAASDNPIGSEGGRALAQALRGRPIRSLQLDRCGLDERAVIALSDALPETWLSLYGNDLPASLKSDRKNLAI